MAKYQAWALKIFYSGTGGLGTEMCIAMAESGADIVSIHLPDDPAQAELEEAVRSFGRNARGFVCDVGDSAKLRETFQAMWTAGVVPDILLNCAGLNRRGAIEEMTDDKIDLVRPASPHEIVVLTLLTRSSP